MLRKVSQWWAKLSYLFTLEVEASKSDINAAIAKRNAGEARKLSEQFTAEAEELEANIKTVEAEEQVRKSAPEYLKLTTKEQYDDQQASKKEKDAALQMVAEKRKLAAEQGTSVAEKEQTAHMLSGLAANSRSFADKIRQL